VSVKPEGRATVDAIAPGALPRVIAVSERL